MNYIIKYFKRFFCLAIFILTLISVSCEEVIDIELNSSKPSLVAEGLIEKDSLSWIRLSYTTDYFNSEEPTMVADATVVLYDAIGNFELLSYSGDGLYKGSSLKGKPNRMYEMTFTIKGSVYRASSMLYSAPVFYGVKFEKSAFKQPGEDNQLYTTELRFSDDMNTGNFYNIEFIVNGEHDSDSYTLITDKYFATGDIIVFSPRWKFFEKDDVVEVIINSIDEKEYEFLNQLNDLSDAGMGGSSTPYNPVSNFGASVLGYFRARSSVSKVAVVK
jgi:hypothetical protein